MWRTFLASSFFVAGWSLILPALVLAADSSASPRFTLVLDGAAVKDNQSGLVWEQEPDRIHDV